MSTSWYIDKSGRELGPYSNSQMMELAAAGQLKSDDLVRRSDQTTPIAARKIRGSFAEGQTRKSPRTTTAPVSSENDQSASPRPSSEHAFQLDLDADPALEVDQSKKITITCPNCRYEGHPTKTIATGKKIKCRKCGYAWAYAPPLPSERTDSGVQELSEPPTVSPNEAAKHSRTTPPPLPSGRTKRGTADSSGPPPLPSSSTEPPTVSANEAAERARTTPPPLPSTTAKSGTHDSPGSPPLPSSSTQVNGSRRTLGVLTDTSNVADHLEVAEVSRAQSAVIQGRVGTPTRVVLGGIVVVVLMIVAGIIVAGLGEEANVTLVKEGHLKAYPNVTVGKAVDAFLASPKWEAVHGNDGMEYVNVRGGAQFMDKPIRVTLQFQVSRNDESFEVNALEMNDLPQNNLMKAVFVKKIFESYE